MEELTKYYEELTAAYDNSNWFFRQNNDCAHNATIIRVMLEKATSINMFCGKMSVFKKDFYTKVEERYPGYGSILKDKVAGALRSFLKKNNANLTVVMENYDENVFDDFIISAEEFKTALPVHLYALKDYLLSKSELPHFSFTENERMVRIETDKESHEAICKIGGSVVPNKLTQSFATLVSHSRKLA